jgi:hypothetical protein
MHDRIYLTGGWQTNERTASSGDMEAYKDTWGFNPMAMKWEPEPQAPHPHHHFASSGDVVSNYFYVMGGIRKNPWDMATGSLSDMVNDKGNILFEIHKLGYPHVARGLEPPRVIDAGITWEVVTWDPPLDPNAVCDDPDPKPLEYELYFKPTGTNEELTFAYKGTERKHRQEGLKPSTYYTWIWRCNNGVGKSGMSPEGDGPTLNEAPKPPAPAPVVPAPVPQVTYRKVPQMIPQKRVVEQVMMVPVKQMVEVIEMVPQYTSISNFEVEPVDAKQLSPGKPVSLYNLINKAEMNGQAGVLEAYDPEKMAWTVKLSNGQGTVTVKPENLLTEAPGFPQAPAVPPFSMSGSMQPPVMFPPAAAYPSPLVQPSMAPTAVTRTATPPPPFRDTVPTTPRVQTISLGRVDAMTPQSTRMGAPRGDLYQASPMKPAGLGQPVFLPEQFSPRR